MPSITVTGEGSVKAGPQLARIRLGVATEAPTAKAASDRNAANMQRVMKALRSAGLAPEAIQTVQFTIEPVYDYPPPQQRPVLRGFQVRNVVEATTRELERLPGLLDAVISAGGNVVESLRFELEDPGAVQAEALKRALADARRKADSLAAAAGRGIGDVQRIVTVEGVRPMPWAAEMRVAEQADTAPPVSPGELTVTSQVEVTYRLTE
jgi:uncharacterized protein YggE